MEFVKKWLLYIYYFAWMALAFSIPLSQILTSISLFTILGAWLLMGDFSYKKQQLKEHFVPLCISLAVFFLFVVGLWNTKNFVYAFKDLKIKLPLLAIPVLIATGPKLSKQQMNAVFYALAAGAFLSAFFGFISGYFISEKHVGDYREYSPFISHIRLSLMLCFSLALLYFFLIHGKNKYRWLLLIPFAFILFYLNLIQSLTSLVILSLMLVYLLLYNPWKYARIFGWVTSGIFVLAMSYIAYQTILIYKQINCKVLTEANPPLQTVNGNDYYHNHFSKEHENGHLVYHFVCRKELHREWKKRSRASLADTTMGYPLESALIRYLSSRGLTKDSLGVSELSDYEIRAIEKGVSNEFYLHHNGIENRIHQTLWEIKMWKGGNNALTNSVAIRLYFWDNAISIIKQNKFLGVGTGDVQDVISQEYLKGPFAKEKKRLRTHNQFLTVGISHGIIGAVLFCILLLYPFITYKGEFRFLYIMIGIIILSSMLWEDTLETQAGATLSALLIYLPFLNRSKAIK